MVAPKVYAPNCRIPLIFLTVVWKAAAAARWMQWRRLNRVIAFAALTFTACALISLWHACGCSTPHALTSFTCLMICATGGAHLTINYFWLNMISLCWASHAAANPAAGPSPTSLPCALHLQPWSLPLTPQPLPQTALRWVGSACLKTCRTVLQWQRTRIKWSSITSCCCRRRQNWVCWRWLWRWLCVMVPLPLAHLAPLTHIQLTRILPPNITPKRCSAATARALQWRWLTCSPCPRACDQRVYNTV